MLPTIGLPEIILFVGAALCVLIPCTITGVAVYILMSRKPKVPPGNDPSCP